MLRAARRLSSWQAGVELTAVAELDARRMRAAVRPRSSRASEHVSDELAAALVLTGRSADILLTLARDLVRLPTVLAALLAGRIDRARAAIFAAELAGLTDLQAAAVAMAFVGAAGSMTTGQLRAALRSMVLYVDPAGLRRRAEKARGDARVEAWPESSGNASLAGRELPPADVIAADERISAIARALREGGAPGTMDQLRAAVFVALLAGRDPETLLPEQPPDSAGQPPDRAGQPPDAQDSGGHGSGWHGSGGQGSGGQGSGGQGSGGQGSEAPAADTQPAGLAALTGSVHLTMPASRVAGPVPCARRGRWPGPDRRLDLPGPGRAPGRRPRHPVVRDPDRPRQPGGGACLCPGLPAPRPASTRLRPTSPPRPRPAFAPRPAVARDPPSASPIGQERRAWLAGLAFSWLESGTCSHARQVSGYRPGNLVRELVKVRQRSCGFPGCRRPARACDDDHTVPYDQGGRSCECNLAPLCRRHHRAKQAPGWRLDQPEPGVLIWTLPHGRSCTVKADVYPT